jgi:U6 snRNA-associated Sm-like protein LSm6
MSKKQTPSEFLKQIIGRPVVVKLNSGVDYRGLYRFKFLYIQD